MNNILICPHCQKDNLYEKNNSLICKSCQASYSSDSNILKMYIEDNKYTDEVKSFYETTPFPKYNDIDNCESLIKRASESKFAMSLNEQLDTGIRILEAGCGTGQMSLYLSLNNRTVYGTDMSMDSLNLAQEFKELHHINTAHFMQMNIFHPIFKKESFDVLISNGVLHHTHSPYKAFQQLLPLVKKNGLVIIGLYHKYGRLWTDFRRQLFQFSDQFLFLDEVLNDPNISEEKKQSWHNDQYKNKHEMKHTIIEVMDWFKNNHCSVLKVLPDPTFRDEYPSLFFPRNYNRKEIQFTEKLMTLTNTKEGGFFTVIGRKEF
jgi:2-polyprenyl-3-methyl-5-hydroxy-6-metoxy-1,4-benzoquinol methylase